MRVFAKSIPLMFFFCVSILLLIFYFPLIYLFLERGRDFSRETQIKLDERTDRQTDCLNYDRFTRNAHFIAVTKRVGLLGVKNLQVELPPSTPERPFQSKFILLSITVRIWDCTIFFKYQSLKKMVLLANHRPKKTTSKKHRKNSTKNA